MNEHGEMKRHIQDTKHEHKHGHSHIHWGASSCTQCRREEGCDKTDFQKQSVISNR